MTSVKKKRWSTLSIYPLSVVFLFIIAIGCSKNNPRTTEEANINWLHDLDKAFTKAKEQQKPLMIDFMAEWCPPCQKMEDSTFSEAKVIQKTSSFVPVRIDVDKQREVAVKYNANAQKYGGIGIPNILFMTEDEEKLKHVIGFQGPEELVAVMDSALTIFKTEN